MSGPLDEIKALWATLDAKGREEHLSWVENQCVTCGRPGLWDGLPGGHDCHPSFCDACCDERERDDPLFDNGPQPDDGDPAFKPLIDDDIGF